MNAKRLAFRRLFISCLSLVTLISGVMGPTPVLASHTPAPSSVTIAGSLQSELGCSGDWQPDCAATHLTYDANDDVWQGTFNNVPVPPDPPGYWEYKAALNDSWTENYGANAQQNGSNITLDLNAPSDVKFYYDHKSHWVTDNHSSRIATAPGSYQSEIGCPGDWQPDCLRSWLQDPDGDGTYTFTTASIPQGSYAFKVAINEAWGENYGQGGAQNGPDIPFNVPGAGYIVTFAFNSATNTPSVNVVSTGPGPDNNVEWDGLRHDSRDTLYRTPGGAVPAGTPVTIRFRTFHNDVTSVKLRIYSLNANAQSLMNMTLAASDVSCYQAGLENSKCDYWAATLENAEPDNLWYRFFVTDGTDTDYYDDNTSALDGGLGAATDDQEDNSFALMVYQPGFESPTWARDAIIYQIFPDRFRNGRADNDPKTGDIRYDDPVLKLPWGMLPEGYCRNYADGATNCPWRFDDTPPDWSPAKESPRGRDYFGGDLKGVDQYLDYLKSLGVNTIYFNPIFDAGSNHSYDTQDYYKVDPYFGTQKDWENLNKHADQLGIRIILDGVFNHMSSDSPFFDRYHHYPTVGACESASSPYRNWFHFRPPAGSEPSPCAPTTPGGNDTYYDGWFGFDSIPVLTKTNPQVQDYFLSNPDSVSKHWLKAGAEGWRLDVMGDSSFPVGYWEQFRQVVKQTDSKALIVGELWQKDSTLLRFLRGDRADTTMNYRMRDAIIGLLAPGNFDSKGFADSGHPIKPSEFAARIASIREDYPDAAYYSLMNLVDSHDTERLLWTLTPGEETTASKELNASNLAEGKQRLRMAALIQFTLPGAPTIYYGDEVGINGDDDPDDRRTYPWADLGGSPDTSLFSHYQTLTTLRRQNPSLTAGDIRVLLADDSADTVAYGRKTGAQAAIVAINRSNQSRTMYIPVDGYLPDGTTLIAIYGVGNNVGGNIVAAGGIVQLTLDPMSGLLLATGNVDLMPPSAPVNLHVTGEGNAQVSLAWNAVSGAAAYNVYRSPLSGGGSVKANSVHLNTTNFTDTGLRNAQTYFYVVRAVDAAGNESTNSNEVSALPHLTIGWANLQWPPSMTHIISVTDGTDNAYGQVWIDGVTNQPGATESLRAQLGFGPDGSDPNGNPAWVWVDASFNVDAGNNDEFVASMLPEQVGTFDYAYRYTTTNGRDWLYADLDGIGNGYSPDQAGSLMVNSSGDTMAPATPSGLTVVSASPDGIELTWDAVSDATLYGYEVRRSDISGGPYTTIALVTGSAMYKDISVNEGATYHYVVRAVDTSFNRSGDSNEVTATAELRTVTLVFNVTVPSTTDATGRSVYIAGFLDRLDGGLPQWNPGGVVLTRVDATHWTITLTGKETVQIEYKYTLGDWEHVEKDAACGEISNRQLTLSYGSTGTQVVNDIVPNWRNVAPCGN
jgi:glycosidase